MDSILDSFLEDDEEGRTFQKENEVIAPLALELQLIDNKEILDFVRGILYRIDEDFWSMPSSVTEGENPPDEYGAGGNVLHTRRVTRIAAQIAIAQDFDQEDFDRLIAACLLHGATKILDVNGSYSYDPFHPYTVESVIAHCRMLDDKDSSDSHSSTLFIEDEDLSAILKAIRCQKGMWSVVPETTPSNLVDWALHLGELLATNLHHMVDGSDVQDWRWSAPEDAEGEEE